MNFGAGAAANYLGSFSPAGPVYAPAGVWSNNFTKALGEIPALNAELSARVLSPVFQIAAQGKVNRDFLAQEQAFTRRQDRRRMAAQLFGIGTSGGSSGLETALTAFQPADPRQRLLETLDFNQRVGHYLDNSTRTSRGIAAGALQRLGV